MDTSTLRKVLCVDDEPHVLSGISRTLGMEFDVRTAPGGKEGLALLAADGPFAVVISDMRMPGMNGAEFLKAVRNRAPDTIRLLLTGQADLDSAIEAVNGAQIFRFLTKPCAADVLLQTVQSASEQFRLVLAEQELLQETLYESVGVLTEVLSLVTPVAFSRSLRLKRYVSHVARHLNLADVWQYELAAMLSHIGCVALSPDLVQKAHLHGQLSDSEQATYASHAGVAESLIGRIPRLGEVAKMIGDGLKRHSAHSIEDAALESRDPRRIGAVLLRTALWLDELSNLKGSTQAAAAVVRVKLRKSAPRIAEALRTLEHDSSEMREASLDCVALAPGMLINADVYDKNGVLLVSKGHEVTATLVKRLQGMAEAGIVGGRVAVRTDTIRNNQRPGQDS